MSPADLRAVLDLHAKWLRDEDGGAMANLTRANLARANLARANLAGANLTRANLTRANLAMADLTRADLTRADLTGANLAGANLTGADLARANLAGANLTGAKGIASHAQVAFRGHGECGRMLAAIRREPGGPVELSCGCFAGSPEELHEYIDGGLEKYRESRRLALRVVLQLLDVEAAS